MPPIVAIRGNATITVENNQFTAASVPSCSRLKPQAYETSYWASKENRPKESGFGRLTK